MEEGKALLLIDNRHKRLFTLALSNNLMENFLVNKDKIWEDISVIKDFIFNKHKIPAGLYIWKGMLEFGSPREGFLKPAVKHETEWNLIWLIPKLKDLLLWKIQENEGPLKTRDCGLLLIHIQV